MEILNIRKRTEPSIRNLPIPILSIFNHISSSTYVYTVFSERFKANPRYHITSTSIIGIASNYELDDPCLALELAGGFSMLSEKNFRFLLMALRMAAGLSAFMLGPFPLLSPCSRHIVLFLPTTVQACSCLRVFVLAIFSLVNNTLISGYLWLTSSFNSGLISNVISSDSPSLISLCNTATSCPLISMFYFPPQFLLAKIFIYVLV